MYPRAFIRTRSGMEHDGALQPAKGAAAASAATTTTAADDMDVLGTVFSAMETSTTAEGGPRQAEGLHEQQQSRLMRLPAELRLRIYEYLRQAITATANGYLGWTRDGEHRLMHFRTSEDPGGTVFLINTIMPRLMAVCKKFSAEYHVHVQERAELFFVAHYSLARRVEDLAWPRGSPTHWPCRPFHHIRCCDVYLSWLLLFGRGQAWAARYQQWIHATSLPELQHGQRHMAWTPTKQIYAELHTFLLDLRSHTSPHVTLRFRLHVPHAGQHPNAKLSHAFDVDDFARLLAADPAAQTAGERLSVTLTMCVPLCTLITSPYDFWEDRLSGDFFDDEFTELSPHLGLWNARMAQNRKGRWQKGAWSFVLLIPDDE